jgi:hypothetical protein
MRNETVCGQSGQTLIQVALALVALLAFLMLAIDGGYLYAQRRHMQNAADAGALAGARELCFGDPSLANDVAFEYATVQNRAERAVPEVSLENGTVKVTAEIDAPTFFAGALAGALGLTGLNPDGSALVVADATAACGPPNSACGLWPVALDKVQWDKLQEAECGTHFLVFNADNVLNQVDCDVCNCDLFGTGDLDDGIGDGIDDTVQATERAWLDFSDVLEYPEDYGEECLQWSEGGAGCGAQEIKCWVENDEQALIRIPSCIKGDTGAKTGVKNAVDSRAGDTVGIPIYTSTDCGAPPCGSGETFNVQTVGCMGVVGFELNFIIPWAGIPIEDANEQTKCWKGHVIIMEIVCNPLACKTNCGGTQGGPIQPWQMRTVSMVD